LGERDLTLTVLSSTRTILPDATASLATYRKLRWATRALGGFADCTFQADYGWPKGWEYRAGLVLRVMYGRSVAYEGRFEDQTPYPDVGEYDLLALGYWQQFKQRHRTNTYTNSPLSDIIQDLITNCAPQVDPDFSDILTNALTTSPVWDHKYADQAIQEILEWGDNLAGGPYPWLFNIYVTRGLVLARSKPHAYYYPAFLTQFDYEVKASDLSGDAPTTLSTQKLANYVEAKYGVYVGTHNGSNNTSTLSDSTAAWTVNEFIGKTVKNVTDGSSGQITANTATTVTAALSGGVDNDWDTGDSYRIEADRYTASAIDATSQSRYNRRDAIVDAGSQADQTIAAQARDLYLAQYAEPTRQSSAITLASIHDARGALAPLPLVWAGKRVKRSDLYPAEIMIIGETEYDAETGLLRLTPLAPPDSTSALLAQLGIGSPG
jgi:hypothetical protein